MVKKGEEDLTNHFLTANLFLLGLIALVAQTVFFREAVIFGNGNELVFGAVVSVWLLGGAMGAYFSSRVQKKEFVLKIFHGILVIFLLLSLFIIRFAGSLIIPFGESANFFEVFLICFLSLFPLNFLLAVEFLICLNFFSKKTKAGPGFSYFLESFGAFFGALIFTFFLSRYCSPWQIIFLLSSILVGASFFLYRNWQKAFPLFFTLMLVVFSFFLPQVERLTRSYRFTQASGSMVLSQDTPYQNITLTREVSQFNLFLNGQPSGFSGENPILQEIAHSSLALVARPEKVLVIGFSTGQLVKEVLKHPVKEVVLVELDPALMVVLKKNFPPRELSFLKTRRLRILFGDARTILKNSREKFEAVIFNLPDPENTILTRLFTYEFFKIIKEKLEPGGILSLSFATSAEHLSWEVYQYNGSLIYTVKKVFPYVKVVPDGSAHLLASFKKINLSDKLILQRLKERKVKSVINPVFLKYKIERADIFTRAFEEKFDANTDDRPISVFLSSLIWESIEGRGSIFKNFQLYLYRNPYTLFVILALLPFAFLFLRKRSSLSIIFSAGLAGMVGELSLIYLYQVVSGYIYSHIGFLLAFFMLGLSLGAYIFRERERGLELVAVGLILLLLLIPYSRSFLFNSVALPFYLVLIGLLGLLVGSVFPLTVAKLGVEQSSLTYSIDLLGGALGAFLGGALMLPLLGVTKSAYLAAIVVFVSILLQKLGR